MARISQNNCNFAAVKIKIQSMTNKIYTFLVSFIALTAVFCACDDDVTYADLRKAENKAIASFIKNGCNVLAEDSSTSILRVDPIKEISEEEFFANDTVTDVSKNEYVLFANSGVYMQIVRKGTGEKLKDGENCQIICRFHEYNISADSLQLSNRMAAFEQYADVMSVTNNSGKYNASFVSGLMANTYGTAVPGGWLMALPFVNLGRQTNESDEIAKVRLIVPSGQGQSYASKGIYGCFYEITMQRGR